MVKNVMTNELTKIIEGSARGGFFLFLGALFSTAILAVNSMIIGRLLGPDLYGQYTLSLILSQLLFLFSSFGINQGLIKFVTDLHLKGEKENLIKIAQSGIIFRVIIGIMFSLIAFYSATSFASIIGRPDIAPYIQLSSPILIFQVICSIVIATFIGLGRAEHSALVNALFAILKFATSIYLILVGFKIAGAILGSLIAYIVVSMIAVSILLFKLKNLSPINNGGKFDFARNMRTLIGFGIPLYASILLTGFIPLYQNFILAVFATNIDLGNFKAAMNFVTAINMIFANTAIILLQTFSKLNSLNMENKIGSLFKIISKYTGLLTLPIIVSILLFSEEIIKVVYGLHYQSASLYLSSLCSIYLLVPLGYITLFNLFNGLGETRMTLKTTLINFTLFLILGPILAKFYSVIGMIAAFLISNSASTIFAINLARKNFKIQFKVRDLLRIYIVAAFSSIPLILFHSIFTSSIFNIVTGILLYLFIYITLIPLTKILDELELKVIMDALQEARSLTLLIKPIIAYQRKVLNVKSATSHLIREKIPEYH